MNVGRRPFVLSCLVAFVSGMLLAYFLQWGLSGPRSGGSGRVSGSGETLDAEAQSFKITGVPSSRTIAPGILVPLDLEFTNPYASPMRVVGLTVTIDAVDAPNSTRLRPCSTDDFIVRQTPGNVRIEVPAGRTTTLSSLHLESATWPHVGMLDRSANQDGCKAATLSLNYVATAELVK